MTSCLTFLFFSEAWGRRRAGSQSETAKVASEQKKLEDSVASEQNKLEDSVESKDREGLDHDLEDEMWS